MVPIIILALTLLTACGGNDTAADMRLIKTDGTVQRDNAEGKSVKVTEYLSLHSGYALTTQVESYGWIALDDSKLAKMDEESNVEIRGTCEWVEAADTDLMCVYLLHGKVECTIYGQIGLPLATETITTFYYTVHLQFPVATLLCYLV